MGSALPALLEAMMRRSARASPFFQYIYIYMCVHHPRHRDITLTEAGDEPLLAPHARGAPQPRDALRRDARRGASSMTEHDVV